MTPDNDSQKSFQKALALASEKFLSFLLFVRDDEVLKLQTLLV